MAVLNFLSPLEASFLKWVKSTAARKNAAGERLALYFDDQADDVMHLIRARWQAATATSFHPVFINIVRKITDKRATVYQRAPRRIFNGWDQSAGEKLYKQIGANVVLKKANSMTRLFKTTMIQVIWNEDRPRLCVVTPNVLDVEHDGFPESPTRVTVTHPAEQEQNVTYSDWTVDGYFIKNYRGHNQANPGNAKNVNPYNIIPFVPLFARLPEDEFFLRGGQDIIEAQRSINLALSNLWRATETQAHGQPVIKGITDNDMIAGNYNISNSGPSVVITLPPGADFKYEAPVAPVEQMLFAVEFLIKQTAVTNDLAANVFELNSKAESGAAKIAESRDLIEARADDLELWRRYEAQLFEVIKIVVNVHTPGAIPDGASMTIDFAEIDEAFSDSDRLQNYRDRMDIGLWSPVDALMADNPDIRTREDALKILQERREEASVLGASFSGPAFGTTL